MRKGRFFVVPFCVGKFLDSDTPLLHHPLLCLQPQQPFTRNRSRRFFSYGCYPEKRQAHKLSEITCLYALVDKWWSKTTEQCRYLQPVSHGRQAAMVDGDHSWSASSMATVMWAVNRTVSYTPGEHDQANSKRP